jgi:hypothetical protein
VGLTSKSFRFREGDLPRTFTAAISAKLGWRVYVTKEEIRALSYQKEKYRKIRENSFDI